MVTFPMHGLPTGAAAVDPVRPSCHEDLAAARAAAVTSPAARIVTTLKKYGSFADRRAVHRLRSGGTKSPTADAAGPLMMTLLGRRIHDEASSVRSAASAGGLLGLDGDVRTCANLASQGQDGSAVCCAQTARRCGTMAVAKLVSPGQLG